MRSFIGTASALLGFLVAAAASPAAAQSDTYGPVEDEDKRDPSFTVLLSQDSFFGFYPSFNGLIPLTDNLDFSFYGILWTRTGFGTPPFSGDDLWTEFGAGVNLHLFDGKLTVKPQLGLTNGALLSGGEIDDETGDVVGAKFADGIVPSLTANYSGERFEAEWYSGYYAALRERSGDAALDFLHLWANGGYKFNQYFSLGGHYELLQNSRNTFPGGQTGVTYEWIGPYVQFTLPKQGFFARFTAGAEIQDGAEGDFYKLAAGISF